MTSPFPGFPPEGLKFLRALKRNNDREWFQARKEQYEEVLRNPMLVLLERINLELMKCAPDYVAEPGKAIFRIYRDTRFSKDKTPYKTHVAAIFSNRLLPRNSGAGFYLQVSTEKVGVGGGIYHPPPDVLRKLREHIVENHAEFQKVIRSVHATKIAGKFEGEPMQRVPKGWAPDHEAAELLKCRSLFFYEDLPAETALAPTLEKEIVTRFKAIAKFVQLLDHPLVGRKTLKSEQVGL